MKEILVCRVAGTAQAVTGALTRSEDEARRVVAQQVTGPKDQILFQRHPTLSAANGLMVGLRHDFQGSDMHYWITPLLKAGHLEGCITEKY